MSAGSRLLYAGPLRRGQTSRARLDALRASGLDVTAFDLGAAFSRQPWLLRAIALRAYVGPAALAENRELISLAPGASVSWVPGLGRIV